MLKLFQSNITPGRRQSKTPILSRNVDQKSIVSGFFYCHLSPHLGQISIENTVSIDFFIPVCLLLITFAIAAYPV